MKLIIYVFTLIIIGLSMYVYDDLSTPSSVSLKTIDQLYYVVESIKDTVTIPIYMNASDSLLSQMDAIDRIRMFNQNIQFDVSLENIEFSHQEIYQDTTFNCFHFVVRIPRLGTYQFIHDLQLSLDYVDQTQLTVYLGVLEYFEKPDIQTTVWETIDAIRHDDIMTIQSFHINALSCDAVVSFSYMYTLSNACEDDNYIATMIDNSILFLNIPIIIRHNLVEEWIIGVTWISSQRMLIQTEGYHHEYTYYMA